VRAVRAHPGPAVQEGSAAREAQEGPAVREEAAEVEAACLHQPTVRAPQAVQVPAMPTTSIRGVLGSF